MRENNSREVHDRLTKEGYKLLQVVLLGLETENIAGNSHLPLKKDYRGYYHGTGFDKLKKALLKAQPGEPVKYQHPLLNESIEFNSDEFITDNCAEHKRLLISATARAALTKYFHDHTYKELRLKEEQDAEAMMQEQRERTNQEALLRKQEVRERDLSRLRRFQEHFVNNGEMPPITLSALLYQSEYDTRPQREHIKKRIAEALKFDRKYAGMVALNKSDFLEIGSTIWIGGESAENLLSHFSGHKLSPEEAIELFTRKVLVQGGAVESSRR